MKYLITKHFHNQGYALFGRVVDKNGSIAEGWHTVTAFVLEKDKELVLTHHAVFAEQFPLCDDSDVIST